MLNRLAILFRHRFGQRTSARKQVGRSEGLLSVNGSGSHHRRGVPGEPGIGPGAGGDQGRGRGEGREGDGCEGVWV